MTVASFIGEGLAPPASLAGRRVSLQHTVVTFLLIELTLFLLCAIAPSFYLEKFGFLEFTPEQFDAQLTAAGVGAVFYICAARLYPVYAAAHILETKLNLKRLMVVLFVTFAALVAIAAATKTTQQYSRLWFFSWALTATEMVLFARLCALTWMNGRLQRGACIYRALSLGLGAPALNAEDIMVSSLVLVLVSPLLLITAIAIKLESGGPVFFRQMREGLNGTHFELLKFRSMFVEQADPHGTRQTSRDDSRVTAIGRIIRKLSIDELPQLFNVLQGSMSLVGPRPHPLRMSAEGKALDQVVDYYASRHRVKSGITGWAQINGLRGEANSIEKIKARVDHDLYYIQNWSIWLDLKIMARTAALLIFDRKAY